MFSSIIGRLGVTKALIEAGADLNSQNSDGETALMQVSLIPGRLNIVNALISAGADLDLQNKYGRTALIFATQEGYEDVVKSLIIAGANFELRNIRGKTALNIATENNFPEIANILRKAEMKLNRYTAVNAFKISQMAEKPSTEDAKLQGAYVFPEDVFDIVLDKIYGTESRSSYDGYNKRKKSSGRRKKSSGRRKKSSGRRKKSSIRRKKSSGRRNKSS
jgi:hypothetical protein